VKNLNKSHSDKLKKGNIEIVCGDGRMGYPKEAPYDAIHIGAAAEPKVIDVLTSQLAENGKLIGPFNVSDVENSPQEFRSYRRLSNDQFECKTLMGVRYVPLTAEDKQRSF